MRQSAEIFSEGVHIIGTSQQWADVVLRESYPLKQLGVWRCLLNTFRWTLFGH